MNARPKIVAIVQARMGASRFPGKVLQQIEGRPMLWHVVDRVRRSTLVDHVIVATSDNSLDQPVAEFCTTAAIDCFRGSERDVLDRYYRAAKQCAADVVVRITADCPLIDPEIIDNVVKTYVEDGCDYATNTLGTSYPDGLDVEVFSFDALDKAWHDATLPADREHVTSYIINSGVFRLVDVPSGVDALGRLRWTVDHAIDLEFVRAVYARLWPSKGHDFGYREVLRLLDEEPSLTAINLGAIRNEGYYRSLAAEPLGLAKPRSIQRSQELKKKAERLIPSGSQTFSKGPSQYIQGVAPVFLLRGQGGHVWDVDDNEYIDCSMALGSVILGHNYPAVSNAVKRQVDQGTNFSLPHPLEVSVAEMLVDLIPCAEMVRFGKNGSDATAGAVRVARAHTKRDIIACCGYHGWQDWYIGTTTRSLGVPEAVKALTASFTYNDIASLERIFDLHRDGVAAVVMEPVGIEEPRDGFLQQVGDLARRHGALLIFDEIVTGFRIAAGGAQQHFGVIPDLGCFGKAMANGYPISAVVGRRDVMELFDEIFFSFTFGGEAVSLAAAQATMTEIAAGDALGRVWEQGQRLKDGYNVLARIFGVERHTQCVGMPPRTVAVFKDESGKEALVLKSLFQQECLKRGILFSGGHNLCSSHTHDDIDRTLRAYRSAMEILADAVRRGDALARLEGKPVEPVFRKA
ncbi:MAG TPA: aminotransferase class III-fold pyridoxal phosphate-dependent enzyme [Verrucomicrobiae bacterium]|jgi:glutamate-1-semialdehyde 2,1-aminomutase/spore coat polysaccharide biosynthesis protein SpsF|nr:aminotransferase class III-fold pyridoxal phosphate-dependent enzyme [Verrucomicrobiae bacterium]